MSATDIEERINAGFAELLKRLCVDVAPDYRKTIRSNTAAREAAIGRVQREYAELGLVPPCEFALSITARRELGYPLPIAEAAE